MATSEDQVQININDVVVSLQQQISIQALELAKRDGIIETYKREMATLRRSVDDLALLIPHDEPEPAPVELPAEAGMGPLPPKGAVMTKESTNHAH